MLHFSGFSSFVIPSLFFFLDAEKVEDHLQQISVLDICGANVSRDVCKTSCFRQYCKLKKIYLPYQMVDLCS